MMENLLFQTFNKLQLLTQLC